MRTQEFRANLVTYFRHIGFRMQARVLKNEFARKRITVRVQPGRGKREKQISSLAV